MCRKGNNQAKNSIQTYFPSFYHTESEFPIHFSGFSTVGLQNPHEVGQNTKNRTDFRFTVVGVVMGVKVTIKAISHIFSTLNLIFSSIFDESQR